MLVGKGRMIFLGALVLVSGILARDWLASKARLDDISIEGYLDPPVVVADGKQSSVLTVQILQDGEPRVGDLVQSFLESGSGLLIPEWAYTDENGRVSLTYSPNPLTPYDLAQKTIIRVTDMSIGQLVEVGKDWSIEVGLEAPPD
ncbi:MAG: Ig-like domain-containing protein [Anaerolineae bacterium]